VKRRGGGSGGGELVEIMLRSGEKSKRDWRLLGSPGRLLYRNLILRQTTGRDRVNLFTEEHLHWHLGKSKK